MLPIVTPAEMAAIDAAAPEGTEVLVARAGAAVALAARGLMGGTYGRRVLVAAGKGNNGADGRVAAAVLERWGARCRVVTPPEALKIASVSATGTSWERWHAPWDLLIDAAYGTGLRRPWRTNPGGTPPAPVLAVDIPSGIDALTGADYGPAPNDSQKAAAAPDPSEPAATREPDPAFASRPGFWQAAATVTFGALKPGLLLHPGAAAAGRVHLAPIGLDCSAAGMWLISDADAAVALPQALPTAHKWRHAVRVIAGSPQMRGAAHLVCAAAQQAGAGMVVVSSPAVPAADIERPTEAIARDLPASSEHGSAGDTGWADAALEGIERFRAVVIGPGLGTDPATSAQAARFIERCPVPLVVDADALTAVADHPECLRARSAPTVLTPHDGEFTRLVGSPPAADRFGAVQDAANQLRATVLLKGPTTLVASPTPGRAIDGQGPRPLQFAVCSGNERLATAGSGDVLAGVIAACLAHHEPPALPLGDAQRQRSVPSGSPARMSEVDALARDVAAAAHWHGRTATVGHDDSARSGPLTASEQVRTLETVRATLSDAPGSGS